MKRSLKLLTIILAALIFISVLSGCNSKPTPTPTKAPDPTITPEPAVTKPDSIKAILDVIISEAEGQKDIEAEFEKLTGIKLDIIQPAHNEYSQKVKLAFASGDVPDVFELVPADALPLIKDGALVELDSFIASSDIVKNIKAEYIESWRIQGKIYGFPLDTGAGCVSFIRKDWLDNVGLGIPTTWDEYYAVLKAFTFNDPDKNGIDDTFGLTAAGVSSDMYLRDIFMDASPDFVKRDGKWVDGFAQPEFKTALERFRLIYQEKLIDPEIFTNKTSTAREKFLGGKMGIFPYWNTVWPVLLDEGVKKIGGTGVVAMAPLKGSFYWSRVAASIAITKACKNPEGVYKYLVEYMHDGGEGQLLFCHGVEGVHWEKKDGKTVKKPSLIDATQPAIRALIAPELQLTPWQDPIEIDPRILEACKILDTNMRKQSLMPSSETFVKSGADLAAKKDEIISKILIGEYSVDEGIEKYKSEAEKLGVSQMLTEFNQ